MQFVVWEEFRWQNSGSSAFVLSIQNGSKRGARVVSRADKTAILALKETLEASGETELTALKALAAATRRRGPATPQSSSTVQGQARHRSLEVAPALNSFLQQVPPEIVLQTSNQEAWRLVHAFSGDALRAHVGKAPASNSVVPFASQACGVTHNLYSLH